MAPIAPQLDHVVLLLPHATLVDPPSWLTSNFTLTPGGTHAGGETQNTLILFADGTYLELIAFVDDKPECRKDHWWGKKDFGVIDYAFTVPDVESFDVKKLNDSLNAKETRVRYAEPTAGGRTREDGIEVKWKVVFPEGVERGDVPFWCLDVTERKLRVPINEMATKHACGAVGMAGVLAQIDQTRLSSIGEALAAIVDDRGGEDARFPVGTPSGTDGATAASIRIKESTNRTKPALDLSLVLQVAKGETRPSDIHQAIGSGKATILFES
ncbi:hypothetical protein LTR95_005691, partial [Oleoguttula sp. CCFEE 5521]